MKHKIYLALNDAEIDELKSLINKTEKSNLSSTFDLLINKSNVDEYVKHYVYISLSDISGSNISKINDLKDLKTDLGLSIYHKRALKNYFQRIVYDLNSKNIITVKECEDLKKVSDCIKLVKSKL